MEQPDGEQLNASSAIPQPTSSRFPVVGIGASAGGLAALQTFFSHLPATTGMAFVIILHLSPDQESHAASILQQTATIPVSQVTETIAVEPNRAYVIPPGSTLSMQDGMIALAELEREYGPRTAIDTFFRTLAETHTTHAACIVLSGTGSDGSVGITRAKETGGIIIAQDPQDAEYDSMPRHAINTGVVDWVLPVAEMPEHLITLWDHAAYIGLPDEAQTPVVDERASAEAALRDVLAQVGDGTGHDFTHYKRATILRRIERRMQVTMTTELPAYLAYIREHPSEVRALLGDLLIGVTNFFRDRQAWDTLERDVIPQLFTDKRANDTVRAWVVGCATGEEAYSVAILLLEHATRLPHPPTIQVFATDIDEEALHVAREGSYPTAIETDVSPTRLRQFFSKETDGYRVGKAVRERVLFASHNILKDPPFSRLDLVTCRNLLIYLNRDVQQQIFEVFHFGLRPGGALLLGNSESVDGANALFSTVHAKQRLFRVNASSHVMPIIPTFPLGSPVPAARASTERSNERRQIMLAEVHQRMLEHYAPPSIIVNTENEIVHLSEHAGRYVQPAGGIPSLNVIQMVLPPLRLELRRALFQALHSGSTTEARRVEVMRDGRRTYVNMIVYPEHDSATNRMFALVMFTEAEEIIGTEGKVADSGATEPMVRHMEAENVRLKEHLQSTVEQYETMVEEAKSSSEELQASNEELRATTEELETNKEELQSVNEELRAVNEELKYSLDEVTSSNDDLNNLISSTDIAMIFLDRAMHIKRFTPRALDLFRLITSDHGRPLADITHTLRYPDLLVDAETVLHTLQPIEHEVATIAGQWYLARLVPYRTTNDRISGVVLIFVDIQARKQSEEALRQSEHRYRSLFNAMAEGYFLAEVIVDEQDQAIDILYLDANPAATRMLGQDYTGRRLREIDATFEPQWYSSFGHTARTGETRRVERYVEPTKRWYTFSVSKVGEPQARRVAVVFQDITERKQAEFDREQLLEAEHRARAEAEATLKMREQFLSVASHELRTPLTSLMGYADMIQNRDSLPALETQMVDRIVRQTHHLERLITELLDVSRLQQGQFIIDPHPFDLTHLVERVAEDARALIPEHPQRQIEVTTPGIPLQIHGDDQRLEQVLQNLVSNAIKYSPQGGDVRIVMKQMANDVVIEVSDQGIGIPKAALPHLFEPFYRATNVGPRTSGFGLGLHIAHEIITRHGGRIDVESVEGQGSTFRIILPHPAS